MSTGHENAGDRRFLDEGDLIVGVGGPLTGGIAPTNRLSTGRRLYRPPFDDAGQTFDTWPWLSHVAAHTNTVALESRTSP